MQGASDLETIDTVTIMDRHAETTQGNWTECGERRRGCACGLVYSSMGIIALNVSSYCDDEPMPDHRANVRFVAHAHQDVPALVQCVEHLRRSLSYANSRYETADEEVATLKSRLAAVEVARNSSLTQLDVADEAIGAASAASEVDDELAVPAVRRDRGHVPSEAFAAIVLRGVSPKHAMDAGRALTQELKRLLAYRLLAAWEKVPDQRLGQLILNSLNRLDLFYMEDRPLVEFVENFVGHHLRAHDPEIRMRNHDFRDPTAPYDAADDVSVSRVDVDVIREFAAESNRSSAHVSTRSVNYVGRAKCPHCGSEQPSLIENVRDHDWVDGALECNCGSCDLTYRLTRHEHFTYTTEP